MQRLVRSAGVLVAAAVRKATRRRAPLALAGSRGCKNVFIYSVSKAVGTGIPERGDRVKMLLLRHAGGLFGPPGGEVEPGEHHWHAAKRESREETGYEFRGGYKELLKFDNGRSRIYLHAVRTLDAPGRPGPLRKGREIELLQHFSLPELRLILRGAHPRAPLRAAGHETLVRVVEELRACGFK